MQSRSIDVGFVPEAETLLARAEKFRTTTLESGAFGWEYVDRGPNVAALREAARLGMTGIEVDRVLGGLGFGFREKVRVAEILSRSSIGFAFSLINTQNVAARLASLGGQRHRDTYLPDLLAGRRFGATALTEPEAGSDFAAITTSATRTDRGWVLNGRKAWITNAVIADIILCYAQTDPELGRDGIACFLVDGRRDGFEATDGYQLVAGSTVGVGGFSLDGYEAVEDDLIIEPGAGFRQALLGVNGARIYVAAMACAAVRAALGQAVEYASVRESFGQPILAHQGLAWSLAAVANRLEAAEAMTARAIDRHDDAQGGAEGDQSHDGAHDDVVRLSALAAAHAKKFATEMIEPALETCMQAMGAEGLRAGHAAGRLLSESRILSYVDGTTEMQTERIAMSLHRYYGAGSSDMVSVATSTASGGPQAAAAAVTHSSEVASEHDGTETGTGSDGVVDVESGVPGELDEVAGVDVSEAVDETAETAETSETAETAEPAEQSEVSEETGLLRTLESSTDPFSPASQGAGLFADPLVADATETMEFEPTGDVNVASGLFAAPPSPPSEPPIESRPATDPPLPTEPPMPPSEPPMPGRMGDRTYPSTPPVPPPPPIDEPADFGYPPPPPPPTGPPLSTDPPMPPSPAAASDEGEPFTPVDHSADGLMPPVPPPEFQRAGDPLPTPPPLPGEEHRFDSDHDDDRPSSPPLPPDSMRTGS